MNIELSEEQEMLKIQARDFLEKECPKTLVRELEESELGYSPELWRKMAEVGWVGLVFPEEYGGTGGSFLDLTILLEEMGRACLVGPFFSTVVLCGLPLLDTGTQEQKGEFLPRITSGEAILALALTEPSASYEAAGVATRAEARGDDYIINGTKLFVPDAQVADWLLCVTRTRDGDRKEDGVTIFLVERRSPGVRCIPFETLADRQCEVVFDKVVVPGKSMVGELDRGWGVVERLLEQAAAAKCAEMLGGMRQVLELTVDFAKERVAYGRPLGSFQVIQHYCADLLIAVELAGSMTYETAWRVSEGLPCAIQVAAAKAWVSEAYSRIAKLGCLIHGAIGFTRDHDMGLYYRRAKAAEVAFGDPAFQREVVARQLGL